MIDGLRRLGITVDVDHERHVLHVAGCGGKIPPTGRSLRCQQRHDSPLFDLRWFPWGAASIACTARRACTSAPRKTCSTR